MEKSLEAVTPDMTDNLFNKKELYKNIKARAIKKNIPIRAWLTRAIIEYIKKEDQYKKLL